MGRYAIRQALGAVFALAAVLVLVPTPAHAASCREVARATHNKIRNLPAASQNVAGAEAAFRQADADNPGCRTELQQLVDWYRSGEQGGFPFDAKDDPKHAFLGPIGWWWNTIYVDWFGRSTSMMFWFGWEIFIVPFALLISGTAALLDAARGR